MTDIAIRADRLGKRYRLGGPKEAYQTLRDSITGIFRRPGRLFGSGTQDEYLWALRDLSFTIRRGEVVGIIGRNGAGKSTLLKILSRITEPTEGVAEIRGRVGTLLEVGTGFHPELTGRENVFLYGAILGMRRAEIVSKFDEIVDFAGVERFIDTPVKRYSSGMYIRLAFAVAAHLEPETLMIDEVLAVGDAEFVKKCLGRVGAIGREGRTVLIVSHNMPYIVNLCQRAMLLSNGKIVADGGAAEVVQSYLAAGQATGGEVVWDEPESAPGTDVVRLRSVRILQEGHPGATGDVDIAKDIEVELTYWNRRAGTKLVPAMWLRDHMGTIVFSTLALPSASATRDGWVDRERPIGMYRSVCRIPANFLNDGLYSITAIVARNLSDTQIFEDNAVSFYVHDSGEMRREVFGRWKGIVRPRLSWQTEELTDEPSVAELAAGKVTS